MIDTHEVINTDKRIKYNIDLFNCYAIKIQHVLETNLWEAKIVKRTFDKIL